MFIILFKPEIEGESGTLAEINMLIKYQIKMRTKLIYHALMERF